MHNTRPHSQGSFASSSREQERNSHLEHMMKETAHGVIERERGRSWTLPPTRTSGPRLALRYQSDSALKTLRFSGRTWGHHFVTSSVLSRLETDELHIAEKLVNLICSDDVVGKLMKVNGVAAVELADYRAADMFWELLGLSVDDYRSQLSLVDNWVDGISGKLVHAILRDYSYYQDRLATDPSSDRAHIVTSPVWPPLDRNTHHKRQWDEPHKRDVRPKLQEDLRPVRQSVPRATSSALQASDTSRNVLSSPTTPPEQDLSAIPTTVINSPPDCQPDHDYPQWTPIEGTNRASAASV